MFKTVLLVLFYFSICFGFSQTGKVPFAIKDDTASVRLIFLTAKDSLNNGSFLVAREYARCGIALANKINDKRGLALCYQSLAASFNSESNNDSALFYFNKALDVCKSINNKRGLGIQYNNIGLIYYGQSKYKEAIANFLTSLKIRESINDSMGIAEIENNIGSVYFYQKAYKDALSHYLRAEEIQKKINDLAGQALSLNNIASIYDLQGDGKKALIYYDQAVELHKKTGDDWGLASALNGLGALYHYTFKDLKMAEKYYQESMTINQKLHNVYGLGLNFENLGLISEDLNNFKGAEKWFKKSVLLYEENNIPQGLINAYERMSEIYFRNGQYKEAYNYHVLYSKLNDSINLGDKLAEMEAKYGKEKNENQISLLKKEKEVQDLEIKRKQTIIYSAVIGAFLLLIFVGFIIRAYQAKKKANQLLELSNTQITHQKEIIEEKSKEISDSINYAKRIQYSLLASDKLLNENLGDHFVLFKPKDVVSGDFYWGTSTSDGFIYITADSTGHGVPGAFMSLLNISKLSQTISENQILRPDLILNKVRSEIISALNPEGSKIESKDGMDAILCKLDRRNMKLEYAAAHNSFYIIRDNALLHCKADKMPVGKGHDDTISFTHNEIALEKGDVIYTFTDGYADQFGGPKGKKFKYKQLEERLLSVINEPMHIQKQILNEVFEKWRGNLEQVDDVCIIGVRI